MESKVSDILEDIYRIDPGLKEREEEIILMLDELLKIKPDLEPDKDFVAELRREVLEKTETAKVKRGVSRLPGFRQAVFSFGALALVVIAFATGSLWERRYTVVDIMNSGDDAGKMFAAAGVTVSKVTDEAFGPLNGDTFTRPTEVGAGPDEIAVHYVPHYSYAGGDFSGLIGGKIDTLKKMENVALKPSDEESEGRFSFGLFDMQDLDDPSITSVRFCESSSDGYCFETSFDTGVVRADCKDYSPSEGYDNSKYASDDERAVAIADDFIKRYKPNMQSYGPGVKNSSFFNTIVVVYPLLINGRQVYDEFSDELIGITVEVSLEYNIVVNASFEARQYQSAAYGTEKDTDKIRAAVSRYIFWKDEGVPDPQGVDLEVGDPTPCYRVRTYLKEDSIHYDEYLVPALAFPVKDRAKADSIGAQKTVIVPIAEGFFPDNG